MPGEPANVLGNEDFAIANWEVLDDVFTDRWAAKCATECVHPYMIEYRGSVSPADVPAPATLSLLLTGAGAAIAWRRLSTRARPNLRPSTGAVSSSPPTRPRRPLRCATRPRGRRGPVRRRRHGPVHALDQRHAQRDLR